MRRITFGRKPIRQVVAGHVRSLDAMGPMPPELAASLAKLPLPRERVRRDATDVDAVYKNRGETLDRPLEATVIRAVEELLAVHPKILFMLRMNAGAASFEAKSGKWAPVWFHRWIKPGRGFRMSDFMGATTDYRLICLEGKRPGFKGPTDQREREQAAFLQCVRVNGGRAGFVTSIADAQAIIEAEIAP